MTPSVFFCIKNHQVWASMKRNSGKKRNYIIYKGILSRCVTQCVLDDSQQNWRANVSQTFFGCFLEASFAEKEKLGFLKCLKLGTLIPLSPVLAGEAQTLKFWCLVVAEQDEMAPIWEPMWHWTVEEHLWFMSLTTVNWTVNCSSVNKPRISSQGFSLFFFFFSLCIFKTR